LVFSFITLPRRATWKTLAKQSEMMAESLMRMLREGPLVSFSGSPTVSPITAASWMPSAPCFFGWYFLSIWND